MFQADVLETIELKTGKRLDASFPFVIGIGTLISGTIASTVAPLILYGDGSIIGYIQPTDLVPNPVQSLPAHPVEATPVVVLLPKPGSDPALIAM
jgi:hypothetical protein